MVSCRLSWLFLEFAVCRRYIYYGFGFGAPIDAFNCSAEGIILHCPKFVLAVRASLWRLKGRCPVRAALRDSEIAWAQLSIHNWNAYLLTKGKRLFHVFGLMCAPWREELSIATCFCCPVWLLNKWSALVYQIGGDWNCKTSHEGMGNACNLLTNILSL
jgi:hypothetical protein